MSRIRLNEGQLRNVIKESVRQILREEMEMDMIKKPETSANAKIKITPAVLDVDALKASGIIQFQGYKADKIREYFRFKHSPVRRDGTGLDFTEAIDYFESAYLPKWQRYFPGLQKVSVEKDSNMLGNGIKCKIRYENYKEAIAMYKSDKDIDTSNGDYGYIDVEIEIIDMWDKEIRGY